jgi:hypothetical protein
MKQGELLKEYATSKKISVAQLGRDLQRERSQIYQLFRTDLFSERVLEHVLAKYPDFADFEKKYDFQRAKNAHTNEGRDPSPPPTLDSGQLAHMILSNSSVSLASYDQRPRNW